MPQHSLEMQKKKGGNIKSVSDQTGLLYTLRILIIFFFNGSAKRQSPGDSNNLLLLSFSIPFPTLMSLCQQTPPSSSSCSKGVLEMLPDACWSISTGLVRVLRIAAGTCCTGTRQEPAGNPSQSSDQTTDHTPHSLYPILSSYNPVPPSHL